MTDYKIIQTYLDQIDLNVVYEKYPIVLYDFVVDPRILTKTLFAYAYVGATHSTLDGRLPYKCSSKHTIVWNEDKDVDVNIINPKYKAFIQPQARLKEMDKVQYVTVKLKKHQVLIVPSFWYLQADFLLNAIELNDLLSFLVSMIPRPFC